LLEVLAGHASVALENARLYEAQRREADHLKALLEFTGAISEAGTPEEIGRETVRAASQLLRKDCALWLPNERGDFRIAAHSDYDRSPDLRPVLDAVLDGDAIRNAAGTRHEPFLLRGEQAESVVPAPRGLTWPDLALAPFRTESTISRTRSSRPSRLWRTRSRRTTSTRRRTPARSPTWL
jgi:GAF domain-containing protein